MKRFVLFMVLFIAVISGHAQVNHQFHLPPLTTDATWSGVSWLNQYGGAQGGAPSTDDSVFIDLDNLNGHTLMVNGGTDQCMSLFTSDGAGIGNSGTLRLASPLKLTGGSAGTIPITLQVHPNLTITSDYADAYFFDLVGNAGGNVVSAVPGSTINIASLKINSTNYTIPYNLTENSTFGNLSVYQGYFHSNGHLMTLNNFTCGNFSQDVVLNLSASTIHINNGMRWYFHNNPSYSNYTGLGTLIYLDQIGAQAGVGIGGKITSPIEHIENTSNFPLNLGTANSFKNTINNLICHTSFYHYLTDNNPGNYFALRIGNLEISRGEIGLYESEAPVVGTEMEIDNITIVSPGCIDRVNLVIRGKHASDSYIIFNNPISLSNVGVRNIKAVNNLLSITNSIDMGGNSGTISFIGPAPAPNSSTWTGAISSDWNNPGNWSDACIPGLNTNVSFVDGALTDTVTTNIHAFCRNMQWLNAADPMSFDSKYGVNIVGDGSYLSNGDIGNRIYVDGSLNFANPSLLTNNNISTFVFSGNGNITSNSNSFKNTVYIEATGNYTLTDSFQISLPPAYAYYRGNFSIHSGGFNSNSKNMHVFWFLSTGKFIRNVNVSDSKIWILMPGNIGSQVYFSNQFNNLTVVASNNTNWIFDPFAVTGVQSAFTLYGFSTSPLLGNVISRCNLGNKLQIQAYGCSAPLLFNKVIKEKGDIEFQRFYGGATFIMDSLVFRSSGNIYFESQITSPYSISITGGIGTQADCAHSYKLAAHSTTTGDPVTFNFSAPASSLTVNNCILENIISSPSQLTNQCVLLGSSSGWTAGALSSVNFYWIGEAPSPVWSDWRNWLPGMIPAAGYGDTISNSGQCVPKFSDNVFFHPNSFPGSTDVLVNGSVAFNDMEWLNGIGLPMKNVLGSSDMSIYGNLLLNQDMTMSTYSGDFNFLATDAGNTIRSKTNTFNFYSDFIFNNTGAWTLLDSISGINSLLVLNKGSLDLTNSTTRIRGLWSYTAYTRQLNLNNAKIFINGWPGGLSLNSTNLTYVDNVSSKVTLMNPNAGLYLGVGLSGTPALNLNATIEYIGATSGNCDGLGLGLFVNLNNSSVHKLIFNKIDGGFHERYSDYVSVVTDCSFDSLIFAVGHTYKIKEGRTITANALLDANGTPCNRTKLFPVTEYYSTVPSIIPAYLCLGPSATVNASFIELSNIQSASCSGFTSNYQALYSQSNLGTTGWNATSYSGILPGIGADTTLTCSVFPYAINANGLVPNSQSTINWSTTETTDSININGPGTYYVSVDYACNCQRSDTIEVLLNNNLITNLNADSISCNGFNDGSVLLSVTNQSPITDYSWYQQPAIPILLDTTQNTINNLSVGNYYVIINDPACGDTLSFIISEPLVLASIDSSNNISCFNANDGTAMVNLSGGTPVYNYSWLPSGGTSNVATGLMPNNYTVTITDNNGCTLTRTFSITEPTALASVDSSSNITCFGINDGSASINLSGGTPGYSYLWSPSGGSLNQANALAPNTYTVTATDNNGCTLTSTFVITEPTQMVSLDTATNISCFGANDGTAMVNLSGGTPGYLYSWLPSGGTANIASGLAPNTYTVTATDNNGCTITNTFVITEPAQLSSIDSSNNITCFNASDGMAMVNVSGGTPGYSYVWTSGGSITNVAGGLGANTYTVTITDDNGCSLTQSFSITEPTDINLTSSIVSAVSCFGDSNAIASVIAMGGTPGYQYDWGGVSTTDSAFNLAAGTYNVTVTDLSGCTKTIMIDITDPIPLSAVINSQINSLCVTNTGSIDVAVSGGTLPLTYLWSNGSSNEDLVNISEGNYQLILTDANGCGDTLLASIACDFGMIPQLVTPNGDNYNDTWFIPGLDQYPNAGVEIYNRWGNLVFSESPYQNNWNGISNGMATIGDGPLPTGTYFFILDLGNGSDKIRNYLELQK